MTTDFDDPGLERRLERRGAELRRDLELPDLHAMITHAVEPPRPRLRWTWPLVAALLLLAVPLVTVLLVRRASHSDSPAAPDTASLQLLGDVPWSDAVLQPDGRSVAVLADVDRTPGSFCLDNGLPVLKPVLTGAGASLHLEVQAFRPGPVPGNSVGPGASGGCFTVGHRPVPVVVPLGTPLNGRSITGGTTEVIQNAAGFLTPDYLPAGYSGSAIVVGGAGIAGVDLMHRTYLNGAAGQLSVIRGVVTYSDPTTVATGTVRGEPARVMEDGHFSDNVCLSWREGTTSWNVCSLQGSAPSLSPGELLRVGNGLH